MFNNLSCFLPVLSGITVLFGLVSKKLISFRNQFSEISLGIFRVALLFICQGSGRCRFQRQL